MTERPMENCEVQTGPNTQDIQQRSHLSQLGKQWTINAYTMAVTAMQQLRGKMDPFFKL